MRRQTASLRRLALGLIYSYRRLHRLKTKLLKLARRRGEEGAERVDYVPRPDLGAGFFTPFGRIIEFLPDYERGVFSQLRRLFAGDNCLFLDVGAYLGEYSVLAAKMGCGVIAFEPNPLSALLLRRNLEGAGVGDRVLVLELGLWERDGTLSLKLLDGSSSLTRLPEAKDVMERRPKEVLVKLTTLDRVYQDSKHLFEGKRVVMKIDVEGAALRVIRGGLKLIEETRPYVVFEVHRGEGEDDELAAVPYFLKLGYRWRLLESRPNNWNFILALRPPEGDR